MQQSFSNPTLPQSVPNLVEIQLNSFQWFLDKGLRELFHNFSPIEDFTGNLSLELVDYYLDKEKYSVEECQGRDMTYERPIKAIVRLRSAGREVVESEVYLGDLPMMTERGTFVVNGVIFAEPREEITQETLDRILQANVGETVEVLIPPTPCSTTADVLSLFAEPAELIEPTREDLLGKRPLEDVVDPKTGRVLAK